MTSKAYYLSAMDTNVQRKLEAVLGRLLAQCDSLALTQAVKLPYLVDVVAYRVLGRSIVGATYEAWDYGVVTKEAYRLLKYELPTYLSKSDHPYSESGIVFELSGNAPDCLSKEEIEVVDAVAEIYGCWSALNLGALTKRMNPQISKWGSNERADIGADAYSHLSDNWGRLALFGCTDKDFEDRSKWGPEIGDPAEYVRRALG
jgi:uncharacterized phage-associated protein